MSTFVTPARPNRSLSLVPVVLALSATVGCGTDDLGPDGPEGPPEQIERRGMVFERFDELVDEVPDPDDAVVLPRRSPADDLPPTPLTDYSREELADLLRPAIATHGHTYVASEPSWHAADEVLTGDRSERSVDFIPRPDGERGELLPVEDENRFRQIIDEDGRYLVWPTDSPYNAIVHLELYTGDTFRGTCTGHYIGPWTLVTAAHCMVYSDTDRANRVVFRPARAGGYDPYGSYDCRLDDADGSNDFLWSVPFGYLIGQTNELDYAVMDTWPCHGAPNWFGGYQANAGSGTYSMFGYPSDTCPGAPAPGSFMCGMSGPANLNEWRIETEHIDAWFGQSGSPWWATFDIDRPVGVDKGYREYYDFWQCGFAPCRRNYARRIDNAFSQFIIDVAWDY